MSVRKLKASWWVDFFWKHRRYRKRSPANSRAGALEYEATLRHRLARGEPVDPPHIKRVTFEDFSRAWMASDVRNNNKPSTAYAKACMLRNYILPELGDVSLDRIDSARLELFKAARIADGLAPKTINSQLSVIHTALDAAANLDLVKSVPRIRWLKVPPCDFKFLSPTDCEKLLACATDDTWRAMILCGLRTGMRFGELTALDWGDVYFDRNLITVRRNLVRGIFGSPKNNRIRHIPIAADLRLTLQSRQQSTGLVFTDAQGQPIRLDRALRWLYRSCARAGIQRVSWHVLRHTFASQLVARGVPIRAVQMLLGHSTILMTERYAHLAPSTLADAINVLVPQVSNSDGG